MTRLAVTIVALLCIAAAVQAQFLPIPPVPLPPIPTVPGVIPAVPGVVPAIPGVVPTVSNIPALIDAIPPIPSIPDLRLVTCAHVGPVYTFTSVGIDSTEGDVLTVVMTSTPVALIQMNYIKAGTSGATAFTVAAAFANLYEFTPGNLAGFVEGLQNIKYDMDWQINSDDCGQINAEKYEVTFTALQGKVNVKCTLPSKALTVSGVSISSSNIKCDLNIVGHQYAASSNRLAFQTTFFFHSASITASGVQVCTRKGDKGVCISSDDSIANAALNWVSKIQLAAGGEASVVSNITHANPVSVLGQVFEAINTYHAFATESGDFTWDPTFGMTDEAYTPIAEEIQVNPTPSSASSNVAFVALVVICVLVSVLLN